MNALQTVRFSIPMLAAGQAHKELFHNEALTLLDFLSHPAVIAIENDPAVLAPQEGDCWLIGISPVGDWTNHANHIAGWTGGGWRLMMPTEAMEIFINNTETKARFSGGNWQTNTAIDESGGGSIVDTEARATIDSILVALRKFGILPPAP